MVSFSISTTASSSLSSAAVTKNKREIGATVLANSYEDGSDTRQTTNGVSRTIYDTSGTAAQPANNNQNKDDVLPGIGYIPTEVHSIAIVNNIFRDADADGDGNLSQDELDGYISENAVDMDREELAAAKFLQQSYGTLSAQDGETDDLTLNDINTAADMQDDEGLSDGDLLRSRHSPTVANALFGKMLEDKAAELGISVEELRDRIYGGRQ